MLLEVVDLRTHLFTDDGVVKAVDGVSFSVDKGRRLGIVGESGCGKSLTALSLARLVPEPPGKIVGGKILLDGRDLVPLSREEMRHVRGREIGFVFQDPMSSLNPVFRIGEQIAERLIEHGLATEAEAKKRSIDMLREVGFPDPENRYSAYPHELSGGLRQRAVIAMALVAQPKLLLADEPTTALDVTIQAQVLELLDRLTESHSMALVLITHDLGIVAERAHDVIVMYAGKIVEKAATSELFQHPLHPYTLGLLASMPRLASGDKKRLAGIEGMVPSLARLPAGCAFADRCPKVQPHCRLEIPPLEEKRPGHWAACFEV